MNDYDSAMRDRLIKFADWLYSDDGSETVPIEQIEEELRESGIDMEQAKVKMKELIARLSRRA